MTASRYIKDEDVPHGSIINDDTNIMVIIYDFDGLAGVSSALYMDSRNCFLSGL